MIRVIIAQSGGGKTYKLKHEIINRDDYSRPIYVIERGTYKEYSKIFNNKIIKIFEPSDDLSLLKEVKGSNIYIDCEDYSDTFLEKVEGVIKRARVHDNQITVTLLEPSGKLSDFENLVLMNANEIYVGKCSKSSEVVLEELLDTSLGEIKGTFDFRKVK